MDKANLLVSHVIEKIENIIKKIVGKSTARHTSFTLIWYTESLKAKVSSLVKLPIP